MKYLVTVIACFVLVSVSAQTPYNPDSDSDNLIGFDDLLDFLPLYGQEFYPETVLQEQWCSVSSYDSCFIEAETDVLFLNMNGPHIGTIGRGPVYLPDGLSFKKIYIIGNEGQFGADIWARNYGDDNYYKIRNSFDSDHAEIFFRTPTGKWRNISLD